VVNVGIGKCNECGMIRSIKDMVLLEDGNHMCFKCWNIANKDRIKTKKEKKRITTPDLD
jgi:hypothetical protein